jgi:hypothetical protein
VLPLPKAASSPVNTAPRRPTRALPLPKAASSPVRSGRVHRRRFQRSKAENIRANRERTRRRHGDLCPTSADLRANRVDADRHRILQLSAAARLVPPVSAHPKHALPAPRRRAVAIQVSPGRARAPRSPKRGALRVRPSRARQILGSPRASLPPIAAPALYVLTHRRANPRSSARSMDSRSRSSSAT